VKTGNSIEDFIENSQRYQADLLTTAIHFYRRKRFQGITGIFQFMLIDCWESVSWSVVDYWGVRKKGYYALRDAFQPLLLSVRLRQYRHYYQGKLGIDLFIINDLYREFPAALLRIKSNKFLLYEKQMVCVPADGLLFIRFEDINSKLPAGMKAGVHQIDVCLQDENRNILAKTIFEIEIVNEP
jgi:beta-mannosidase